MTSIRRLLPGISSLFTRATSLEVSAPLRKEVAPPVEPVRTGFSDHSDFQPDLEDGTSPLSAHAPLLASRPGAPMPEPLRSYTGESDFQARAPRYGHLLGTGVAPPGVRPAQGQATPGIRASSLLHAAPRGGEPVDRFEPPVARPDDSGFIADLSDLPLPPEPEELLSLLDASSHDTGFTVQEADIQPERLDSEPPEEVAREAPAESVPPSLLPPTAWAPPEHLDALSASESLDVARDVATRGSPEQQARVATTLYTRGQTPELADAATYQRAAALAATGSPEATQALLSQVGDANASAFVRAVLRDG